MARLCSRRNAEIIDDWIIIIMIDHIFAFWEAFSNKYLSDER